MQISCKSLGLLAAAAAGILGLSSGASAAAVSLADLIRTGGTIQQGDKLFWGFTYSKTGQMPTDAGVNIEGIGTGVGTDYYGIRITGGFSDLAGDSLASDAFLTYNVTVLDPSYRITDVHMFANLAGVGSGTGSVTETFVEHPDLPGHTPSSGLFVFDLNNTSFNVNDNYVWGLPGDTTLHVTKDIMLNVDTGLVTLSQVDQRFSQTAVPLPAAAWGGLSMLGGLGLFGAIRRRRQA